jgi:hypothetical protein
VRRGRYTCFWGRPLDERTARRNLTLTSIVVYGNALIAVVFALYFLLLPGATVVRDLRDPAMKSGGIPRKAWAMHHYLTPRYEEWAKGRVADEGGASVHYLNVSGTEWPMFGSVFYLWATEHLQDAWEKDHSLSKVAPAEYARGAVEACKDLILDPAHHSWVRKHWGDDYMHQENVFFRSLVIAGLTSYERLTKSGKCVDVLRDQAATLAAELDASPYGVLHDYPGECYPIDVLAAVAWIRRADAVLGTDSSGFATRELRGFTGAQMDKNGLFPWTVDPQSGVITAESRGIVNSHVLIFTPELYPDRSKGWYDLYEKHFWQENFWCAGFREFYRDWDVGEWTYDVDAGPVLAGFGSAASAFGMVAARTNGRMDHAYTLSAEMLAACWPLPNGCQLGPRTLSDPNDAPYLGEVAILWQLTETPRSNTAVITGGRVPGSVYAGLLFYFGVGSVIVLIVFMRIRHFRRGRESETYWIPRTQFVVWLTLLLTGLFFAGGHLFFVAGLVVLAAQFLPIVRRKRIANNAQTETRTEEGT